jgi:hypothetical protein
MKNRTENWNPFSRESVVQLEFSAEFDGHKHRLDIPATVNSQPLIAVQSVESC